MPSASASSAPVLLRAPVLPTLWRLAVPNMVAMMGSAVAAVGETAYVGQLGVAALAGIALVFPLLMLQQMFSGGAMGGAVASLVSRALGAGETARAEALVVHALGIAVVAGLATTVLMLALSDAVFGLLGGRDAALAQAVAYAHVAFLGSVGVWLLNTLSAVLRATGNMLVPSAVLIAVGLAQVGLASVFGLGAGPVPRMGMQGIALGQVLAYGGGTVVLGWYLHSGKARIRLRLRDATWQPALARDLLQLGVKACAAPVQTIGTMMILTWLVARSGPQALAGYGIGMRLEFLLVPLAFSFGAASVPLIGMAIGAGQVARARHVGWTAAAMAGLLLGAAGLVLAVVPELWTDRFTHDPAVLRAADTYFHWVGPFYALYGAGLSLYSSAIAANRVGGQVLAGTLRFLLVGAGGAVLVAAQAPVWAIFALVAVGLAVYGTASIVLVRCTPWGPPLRMAPA